MSRIRLRKLSLGTPTINCVYGYVPVYDKHKVVNGSNSSTNALIVARLSDGSLKNPSVQEGLAEQIEDGKQELERLQQLGEIPQDVTVYVTILPNHGGNQAKPGKETIDNSYGQPPDAIWGEENRNIHYIFARAEDRLSRSRSQVTVGAIDDLAHNGRLKDIFFYNEHTSWIKNNAQVRKGFADAHTVWRAFQSAGKRSAEKKKRRKERSGITQTSKIKKNVIHKGATYFMWWSDDHNNEVPFKCTIVKGTRSAKKTAVVHVRYDGNDHRIYKHTLAELEARRALRDPVVVTRRTEEAATAMQVD